MSVIQKNPGEGPFFSGVLRGAALRTYLERRKLATVVAVALALFVGYHVVFGHNGLTVYWQKRQDEQQLTARLRNLQTENSQLKAHVQHLQTDPDAIEHQAREELHYTRPGEVIYTLPATPGQNGSGETNSDQAK
jgi:cell division protein FtsB